MVEKKPTILLKLDLCTCSLFSIASVETATSKQPLDNKEQVRRSNFN